MSDNPAVETSTIMIGKKNIHVRLAYLNQNSLKFYPQNPRVYSVLNASDQEPAQDEIEKHMCEMEHVKQLAISIKSNGGLIDPLVVRDGDFTVLEGNSRLAAYRILCSKDPISWGKVRCMILPVDIDDAAIFELLGQYHIVGRKDWEPFEQASYLYRRHQETKIPVAAMADQLGITHNRAEMMIKVIAFMIQHKDLNKRHWSHYEEYLKNPSLREFRNVYEGLDDKMAGEIKDGQIREAADIRKLGEVAKIARDGDKQAKKAMNAVAEGGTDLYQAYDQLSAAGKLGDVIKKLQSFKEYVNRPVFDKQVLESKAVTERARFEIAKILERLVTVATNIKQELHYD